MPRPAPSSSATALALALALFAAPGLAACADGRVADEIPPVVLTDQDGVIRGPDAGATPVAPPSPAPAGDVPNEREARREVDPAPTTADDRPAPPPPSPDADTDDTAPDETGGSEVDETDDADAADDTDDTDSDDGDGDGDD